MCADLAGEEAGAVLRLTSCTAGAGPIALDARYLYWTTISPAVEKVSLDGGAPIVVAGGDVAFGGGGIAVDADRVYWTSPDCGYGGDVMSEPLAGGSPATVAAMQGGPRDVAVDGTSVYWGNSCAATVEKRLLDGGATVVLASGQSGPDNIVVDATRAYWTNDDGTIVAVPLSGGPPVTLATASSPRIAVNGGTLYWTDFTNGTVMSEVVDAGVPVTLASGQSNPGRIAADGTSAYWINGGTGPRSGAVMKVSLGGSDAAAVASGLDSPVGIAVDELSVYWTDSEGIFKARK